MRVALVSPYAWDRPGGVQTHISSLAAVLKARDHDVLVIAPYMDQVKDGAAFAGRAVEIPANGSVAPISFPPGGKRRVRLLLERFDPDVVHAHEPLVPSISMLSLWATRAPVVGTFHAAAESSAGYRIGRPLLNRVAARLTARTAVSDAARTLIARYLPGDYALTPNGVDTKTFANAPPLNLGPGKHVVFLGRLERRKGLEVLIQAFTRLRDLECDLVIAGDGPERKSAEKLVKRLDVPAHFLGRVDNRTKACLLAGADVYCAPGLGGESFGIVLVEAMAAGAPVVCSKLPGFTAVAGRAAVLVDADDRGLLADALRRVLEDDELARRMAVKGKQVSANFDWGRLVANVESIYERAREARS